MTMFSFATRSTDATVALLLLLLTLATRPASGQEAVSLLNGSSLKGWKMEHAKANAREGVLTIRKGPGWVRTDRVFVDFVLSLEVRLLTPDAKATVFVHAWPTFDPKTSEPNNGHSVAVSGSPRSESGGEPSQWRRLR